MSAHHVYAWCLGRPELKFQMAVNHYVVVHSWEAVGSLGKVRRDKQKVGMRVRVVSLVFAVLSASGSTMM